MEGLLHCDFAPGLALADQVRRRFGSTVHFSPSRDSKEFFLVVSFSSASFTLSVDSVGVALQCCIGGISSGFKVVKINSRSFRFSVANNKVGHFIYRLRDRIWPDFVCHFHLFNGHFAQAPIGESCWHADKELTDLSTRQPMALKSSLGFLQPGSHLDSSSKAVMSKFGLVPIDHMRFSNRNDAEASSSSSLRTKNDDSQNKHHDFQISFGTFTTFSQDNSSLKSPPVTTGSINSMSLMEHFLSQADLEENQLADYIKLGTFKCPLTVPCPSPPQCFLKSAFK